MSPPSSGKKSSYQVNIEIGMKHDGHSLIDYIEKEEERIKLEPLKYKIKESEFLSYFNYGLTTQTWNLMVNK